jgi:hypothetical protein
MLASSNVDNVSTARHLPLVVGELDTNVDPSSTLQVVNQLIKHDKNFDLLVGALRQPPTDPRQRPTAAYGDHAIRFFVQHLLATPPNWNRTPADRPRAAAIARSSEGKHWWGGAAGLSEGRSAGIA